MTTSTTHRVARWMAAQGWHVHPLSPGAKIPPANCRRCSPSTVKRPNEQYIPHTAEECRCIAAGGYCHGVRAATTRPDLIDRWWGHNPAFGVGVAAGPSNLVIIDLDTHQAEAPEPGRILPGLDLPADLDPATVHNGLDVLAMLCELRGVETLLTSPPTMTVRTPSGGVHLWYSVPDGTGWKPNARGALGWQVDVRADYSYAVAPGTTTDAGEYTALGDCRAVAPMPVWLAKDLERVGLRRTVARTSSVSGYTAPSLTGGRGYVATAVTRELEAVAACRTGRSDQLNKSAYALGQLVGAGLLDRDAVHEQLTEAATYAGIDAAETKAQSTIRRGIEAGARAPRQIGARR